MEIDQRLIIETFVAEAAEHIEVAEAALLQLEVRPDDTEHIDELFRALHSLKGDADALGFPVVTRLAHGAEDILDDIRSGKRTLTRDCIDLLLQGLDLVTSRVERIRSGEQPDACSEIEANFFDRCARLESVEARGAVDPDLFIRGEEAAQHPLRSDFLRVEASALDRLMDSAGEMAVLLHRCARLASEPGGAPADLFSCIEEAQERHRRLQDQVYALRAVPLTPLLRSFMRTVRDLAPAQGKRARLVVESGDVAMDTNVTEALREALTHLVRNAIAHGVETPEVRGRAKKDPTGTITLRARREGTAAILTVEDDGKGLDLAAIEQRARASGLLNGPTPPERELLDFVFQPAFSTAEHLSELSGRGVGMDVVRSVVRQLRGTVSIGPREGGGTKVTLEVPLSLALLTGFSVMVGGEAFVFPRETVHRCLPLTQPLREGGGDIVSVDGAPVPVVRLSRTLGLAEAPIPRSESVLVVRSGERRIAFAVDELMGEIPIVLEPPSPLFGGAKSLAGVAVTGSGQLAVVLDVAGLFDGLESGSGRVASGVSVS